LKCIRSDNGGEYIGPFDKYCREQGIRHQKTPPKTPQLNGLAERMNRTLVERVRCMLSDAKLPDSFWAEALNTAAYIINLSPAVALNGDVPDRVWSGKNVSYDHLKVFGCKAFVHVPKDERSKLDVKTRQCIFVGYGQDEFGYRFFDPVEKKLVRSRDVVFFEDQTIEDLDKSEKVDSQSNESLVDVDPVPLTIAPERNLQNDENHVDNEDGDHIQNDQDAIDAPVQNDVVGQQPTVIDAPESSLRRSTRERIPSSRYSPNEYVLLTDGGEPESLDEAMESEEKEKWFDAMEDEMKSLHDNHTFDLVKLPKDRKALKNRWVFRVKHEDGNPVPRYKARLVVKGFN